MNNDNKRIIICLPNKTNISGAMTIEFAKSHADKTCPDFCKTVTIVVADYNFDTYFYCLERKEGKWREKEVAELEFA